MSADFRRGLTAAEFAMTAILLAACSANNGQPSVPAGAAVPESWQRPPQKDEPKKESARAPAAPVPAEARTPVEATQRAADPKAPTGALIVKPPINVVPPDSQTPTP